MLNADGEVIEYLTERAKSSNLLSRMNAVEARKVEMMVKDLEDGMSRRPERNKLSRTYAEDLNLTACVDRCKDENSLFEYREQYLKWAKRLDATYRELGVTL